MLHTQEVTGPNPVRPTIENEKRQPAWFLWNLQSLRSPTISGIFL